MFISFEGIEASGKSTLMAAVDHALRAEGQETLITREPGGTPAGNAVRKIFLQPGLQFNPLAETLLVNASRAQLVSDVIRPALARGVVVLCDRYVHSTLAYQGYGRGLPIDLVVYARDTLKLDRVRRIERDDPYFQKLSGDWGNALRRAFADIDEFDI